MRDITKNRHKGAKTSQEAFERIKDELAHQAACVLELYREHPKTGLTVHEVADTFGYTPNQVSGRLSELKRDGYLIPNGERRGRAAVLVINPKLN